MLSTIWATKHPPVMLNSTAEVGMRRKDSSIFPLFTTASIPAKGPHTHLPVPKLV